MVTTLFYIFQPTVALLDAMIVAEEKYVADVSVWATKVHDRTGPEQTQEQVESAFWTIFLSKLVADDPEPVVLSQLRAKILRLGFAGCWSVVRTRSGGPASELMEDALDAEAFVFENVLNPSVGKKN